LGQPEQAIQLYRTALDLEPNLIQARINLAAALAHAEQYDEAIAAYNDILLHRPRWARIYCDMGEVCCRASRFRQAVSYFSQAVSLDETNITYRVRLADVLLQLGEINDAQHLYYAAAKTAPDRLDVLCKLALLLAMSQDQQLSSEATRFAKQACMLTGYDNPGVLDVLAVTLAADEKFDEAVKTAQKAIQLAREKGDESLLKRIEQRLALYQTGRSYAFPLSDGD